LFTVLTVTAIARSCFEAKERGSAFRRPENQKSSTAIGDGAAVADARGRFVSFGLPLKRAFRNHGGTAAIVRLEGENVAICSEERFISARNISDMNHSHY
jgi:hypothetical protein